MKLDIENLRPRFNAFWFAGESRANLVAARILLAGTALWMVLSRYRLPSIAGFPPEMWNLVSFARRARFGYFLDVRVENLLFIALHLALIGALLGLLPRLSCIVSGILLVHFAPLETILWTPNPYLRGMTIPALGLLAFGFAGNRERQRWPLVLTQVFFAQIYFFAGYAKVFTSGFGWISAANIRGYLLMLNQFLGFDRTQIGYALAPYPFVCAFIAWAGIAFDLLFPIVIFKPWTRRFMLPLAVFFHVANAVVFHVVFQNTFLLLMFVDWEAVAVRVRTWIPAAQRPAAGAPL
jgi:vitamin K-dependent gamma-carboxylase-like protein